MSFYEQISKYYDYIFPVGGTQLNFIKQAAGSPPKKILDVACGSGGYSIELARSGHQLYAIDLDDEMINMAKKNAQKEGLDIRILKCDMREIANTFQDEFDLIFCIGNSIVHLGSLEEILKVLKQMHQRLNDGGTLILQIINYDRIIKFNVNELPIIKNDKIGLEFIRRYQYDRQQGLINFNTVLTVSNEREKEVFENSIKLLPVTRDDMKKALEDAGFNGIEFYGDFNYSPYNDNSFMLVVRAKN